MVRCSYQSPFCKSKKPPAAVTITQQRAAATATAVAAEGRGVRAPVQVFPGVGPGRGRARFRAAERLASGQSPFAKAAPERMPEAAAQQRDGRNAEPPLEPAHQPDPHGQQQVGDGQAVRQRQPRRRRRCRRRWFAPPMPKGRRRVPAPGRRASLRRHGWGAAERAVHAMPPRWRGSAVLEVFLACHIISRSPEGRADHRSRCCEGPAACRVATLRDGSSRAPARQAGRREGAGACSPLHHHEVLRARRPVAEARGRPLVQRREPPEAAQRRLPPEIAGNDLPAGCAVADQPELHVGTGGGCGSGPAGEAAPGGADPPRRQGVVAGVSRRRPGRV